MLRRKQNEREWDKTDHQNLEIKKKKKKWGAGTSLILCA